MKKLRVTINGTSYDVEVEVLENDDYGAVSYAMPSSPIPHAMSSPHVASTSPIPSTSPAPKADKPAINKKEVTSPIAGTVVEIKVKVGDVVKENDVLVILEAMKMNTNISSPSSGKIKTIDVSAGVAVKQGQILLTFE